MNKHIVNGDCYTEILKISDKSIDLVLIDPPYLISRKSGFQKFSKDANQEMITKYGDLSIDFGDWDKDDLNWSFLFSQYYRVLRNGGTLIIFYDIWKSSELKKYADENKFKQPRVCQWQKTNPVPINSSVNYLSNAIEYFFCFVKGQNPTFNSKYDSGVYKFPICHGLERTEHPTQKPLGLIKELILKHTNSGDTVLDSFAGSGTTGVACEQTDRKYILIEREKKYFDIINQRLNKIEDSKYIK